MSAEPLNALRGPQWIGQRVLVVGLARSGTAAAKLLTMAGAVVRLHDRQAPSQLPEVAQELIASGMAFSQDEDPRILLDSIDAIIISPGVPIDSPLVLAAKERGIQVLGEMELGARFAAGPIYAITGTNGKTTTVTLLGEMLRQAGLVSHVTGNVGYPLTAAVVQAGPDDPLVTEVSSFQLESMQLFHPNIAAVLNVTPDHLNRHGTMANYANLKRHIADNQTVHDFLVLNLDDKTVHDMGSGAVSKVYWFSRTQAVSFGTCIEEGQLVFCDAGGKKTICRLEDVSIPGAHNLENALAASCMAMLANVPPAVIRHTLRSFSGVEHRLEFVLEASGVRYINDSKGTNPDATMWAIRAMSAPFVLLAGGFDKQVSFDDLARCAAEHSFTRAIVLYGQTAGSLASAFLHAGLENVHQVDSLSNALALAIRIAEPGFAVLLSPACSSFDQFSSYEERGRIFKQLVMQMTGKDSA